jgi:Na+-translocating ferredoxin:NAD+ oxidoreductase RnfD subunit
MVNFKSVKIQLILYLACFAAFLAVKDKDYAFLLASLAAVISASAVETVILYFKNKVFRITESAVITVLITGYVLSSGEAWWTFVIVGAAAILSKHAFRFSRKHLFNPAAFGIFLSTIALGASTQWKGTYLWYILVPCGVYFTYKIRKLEVIAGYAAISVVLFGTQAFLQRVPVGNIFGYVSYFFIFVMLIEPKTSPLRPLGKYLFGAGTAGLIFVLTESGVTFDAELFSLLVMNAAVPLLNKLSLKKGGAK